MPKKALNGVHVQHCKNTSAKESVRMPVPDQVIIPMVQHLGGPCQIVSVSKTVKVPKKVTKEDGTVETVFEEQTKVMPLAKGDAVTVGQRLADSDAFLSSPIFSSVSGKIAEIRDYTTSSGSKCQAIVIDTDKLQTPCPDLKAPEINSHADLIKAARDCGLVGLGGAGFPTHIKLNPKNLDEVDTLVVNGAECEPYITCDHRMMVERTEKIVKGAELVKKYLNLSHVIIGIEDNKPECIAKMNEAISGKEGFEVKVLKSKYPQGGEKVLVYECTGRVIMEGKLPADAGCIVDNVATLEKLEDFVETGMPLVEKMITVDGSAVKEPKNVIVPIGAKISDIIAFCGGYKSEPKKILYGGPMMGIAVNSVEMPLVKNNNAILAFAEEDVKPTEESPCIRCGRCLRACPFNLAPAKLDKAYRAKDIDALVALKVNLCMECGCCTYVCPAKRNLAASNKLAKQLLRQQKK